MIDRQEKLWLIRQQIAKAIAEIDHGDTAASCLALANALGALLSLLDQVAATQEVLATKLAEQREVKEPLPADIRRAVDDLRTESTKIRRR